ncbi:unnamed protein product [Symbiodinium sp. CCMP2592]|nr:unnamed protein product [Symbiodinium sp. CCMP2592]
MWTGSGRTTTTERSLTLYVTNIPENTTAADVSELFSKDEGFCGLRAVGGSRKMVFVDFGSETQATQSMRRHQGHCFEGSGEGLMIDFDHDKRTKRSRAIEKPWNSAAFNTAATRSACPAGWGRGKNSGQGRGGQGGRGRRRLPSREREAAMFRREQAERKLPDGYVAEQPPAKTVRRPPSFVTVRKANHQDMGAEHAEPGGERALVAYGSSESSNDEMSEASGRMQAEAGNVEGDGG